MRKSVFFTKAIMVIGFILCTIILNAQELSKTDKASFKEAMLLFEDEYFLNALPIFNELVNRYPNHFEINYYTGACYLNTRYQKDKAIPYLEKASKEGESSIPSIVHKDLGDLYHITYDFETAIYHYNKYIDLAPRNDEFVSYCQQMITTCTNAKYIVADTLNINIENLGAPINTKNSEYAPYVSVDDSIMFFTRTKFYTDEELLTETQPDTLSHLYIAVKNNNKWGTPKQIELKGIDQNTNVSMAGMSPDGEYIYINATVNGQQDIFEGRYLNGESLNLIPLPYPINTEYWEGKITLSSDGNTLWFSSKRPGGMGGKDIYKSLKTTNGWGTPELLGDEINTAFDEDAPFIHPSGKIFYFSSNGHNTIGGYDVFSVLMTSNLILPAENMGFPINTTSDDMYFVLASSGKYGYLSSSYGNKYGNHDIYNVEMNMNIPLTIIKGTIMAGNPAKPVAAKIRVIDNSTGQKLKYVYNPNPKTGRYLLIFPPGKDYTMIIESEDFLPQSIAIKIPYQESFYELYQSIVLKKVISLGQQIGEQVEVNNSFYEKAESDTADKNYDDLFNLIENIIANTDSIDSQIKEKRGIEEIEKEDESISNLFNLIDEAFKAGDVEKLNDIQKNTIIPDKYEQVFLYSEQMDTAVLNKVIVGNDTLLTSPGIKTFDVQTEEKTNRNDLLGIAKPDTLVKNIPIPAKKEIVITPAMLRGSKISERRIIIQHQIYFDYNQYQAADEIQKQLSEIAELLVNNKNLGFVISGYTDNSGNSEYNKELSQKRAVWVLDELKELGVKTNKAIIESHGEENATKDKILASDRRVTITIFELIIDKTTLL